MCWLLDRFVLMSTLGRGETLKSDTRRISICGHETDIQCTVQDLVGLQEVGTQTRLEISPLEQQHSCGLAQALAHLCLLSSIHALPSALFSSFLVARA
jgi:hypothetical protein